MTSDIEIVYWVHFYEFEYRIDRNNLWLKTLHIIYGLFKQVPILIDPCGLEIWLMTFKKTIGHIFYTTSSFVHHFKATCEFKLKLQPGNTIWVKLGNLFVSFDLEIWLMTLKNKRALLLYYVKLWTSFQSHQWIHTWERSIWVKISDFFVPCDLEIWWKTIAHLFFTTSSIVHHVKAISEIFHRRAR